MKKATNEGITKEGIRGRVLKQEAPVGEGSPQTFYPALKYIHSEIGRVDTDAHLKMTKIFENKTIQRLQYGVRQQIELKRELCDNFKSANSGVRENREAGARLREKIEDDINQCVKLSYKKKNVEIEVNGYKTVKSLMETFVEQYSKFEKFLKSVADTSEVFNSVGDVLNRYEMLEASKRDIAEILKDELDGANVLRRNMLNLVEEKATSLKKLVNKLIILQVARKEAKERRHYWETKVDKIKSLTEKKTEEDVVLKGACGDLYRKLCKSRGHIPTIAEGNIEQQLAYIRKQIAYEKDIYSVGMAIKPLQQAGVYKRSLFIRNDVNAGGDN